MGSCFDTSPEALANQQLSNELASDKRQDRSIKKLLFLGAGGSGKSTIFKQLKKIHGDGWDKEYLMSFTQYIHVQIIEQMKLSIDSVAFLAEQELIKQYGDDYKTPNDFNPYSKLSSDAQKLVVTVKAINDPKLNEETAKACKLLWKEPIIKDIYENRATMKLEDSAAYFFDKIDDIMKEDFVPNEDDILLVRLRSTGVTKLQFRLNDVTFHIFDVGGQKSERKKWVHCFENVTAVIFVVSLSCYDEVMFEDEKMNSMVDSLQLFDSICNNEWFKRTSIILFLNKKDLFAQKLAENKSITLCSDFEDYDGDATSFDETTVYIRNSFTKRNKSPDEKKIFTHLTCAMDKNNVETVFNDVKTMVIESSLGALL